MVAAPAVIDAAFVSHRPATRGLDRARLNVLPTVASRVVVEPSGAQERIRWTPTGLPPGTRAVAAATGVAGLMLGYSATRSASDVETATRALRQGGPASAPQRVQGLFRDSHVLTPLAAWLPQLRRKQPRRFAEVCRLVNRLLGPSRCVVTGETAQGECLFARGGVQIPFPALRDAYLEWCLQPAVTQAFRRHGYGREKD